MTSLGKKKEMIKNFSGFYINSGFLLYENPESLLVKWDGSNKFEEPTTISSNYDIIMGRCVQTLTREFIESALCSGASTPLINNIFYNNPQLYVLKWNKQLEVYEGKLADMDDTSQYTFQYW